MAELTWTTEAERWLRDIHDYIAQYNPSAAIRTVGIFAHNTSADEGLAAPASP
jgi:plasmid stabilization system protein ParE